MPWWTLLLQPPHAKDGYAVRSMCGCCGRCEYVYTCGKCSASFSGPPQINHLIKPPKTPCCGSGNWQELHGQWHYENLPCSALETETSSIIIWPLSLGLSEIFHILKELIYVK